MKPLLLLDIDGVLLPFGKSLPRDIEMIDLGWGQLPGSPMMRKRLARLGKAFELHWATMWQDTANDVIGPWHYLPHLPCVKFVDWDADEPMLLPYGNENVNTFINSAAFQTYKLDAILAHVGDRPMAWIDDHIFDDGFEWMHKRNEQNIPTLLLRTNPSMGMTDADVEYLLAFAKTVKEFVPATEENHGLS